MIMQEYGQFTDEELIRRLRQGESAISEYLLDKYKEMVRRRARAMFLVGGETDDLIQEGMIGLFKAIRDYQEDRDASFQTFARLCVQRQIYTAVQASNRKKNQPLNTYVPLASEGEDSLSANLSEDPETQVIARENADALARRVRETLSPMENQVFGYYLEGLSYSGIGERIGKPVKSVENTLQRIRTKLKEQLRAQE